MRRLIARIRKSISWVPRPVRRVIVLVIGGTFLLLALLGFVLPILPGWVFVPAALGILAIEFAWARRWLKRLKRGAHHVRNRVWKKKSAPSASASTTTSHEGP